MTDAIDLSTVTIVNSPDVRAWPATAALTQIAVTPDNIRFRHTKQVGADRWPDQPFGDPADHGTIQYTVWLFLQLNGRWVGAGFIQMWFGRDGVGDSIHDFLVNWYDSRNLWPPMTGHVVAVGETIGFMVTAGNARLSGTSSVAERSNVVTIAAPPNDTGVFTFPADAPTAPPPVPVDDLAAQLEKLLEAGDRIVAGATALVEALDRVGRELDNIQRVGVKVHP